MDYRQSALSVETRESGIGKSIYEVAYVNTVSIYLSQKVQRHSDGN
jgi:hypothetical protein